MSGSARSGALAVLLLLAGWGGLAAQAPESPPPSLQSMGPDGLRRDVTESAWTVGVGLRNPAAEDINVRVLSYYPAVPDWQYGRDLWVPGRAAIRSWYGIGPPPPTPDRSLLEFNSFLYVGGSDPDHLLRPREGRLAQSHLTQFHRRELSTAVLLDSAVDDTGLDLSPRDRARLQEVRDLARVFRNCLGASETVSIVTRPLLPPAPETFEALDHILLASDRIAEDVGEQDALRGWVQRGGTLWVLLDRVQPNTVAAVLGDAVELTVVDRISVTEIDVRNGPANGSQLSGERWEADDPVEFVRAVVPGQAVLHTLDGWPASSVAEVGRGRVFFTMLGPRGWVRPRGPRDGRSPYPDHPNLPVARPPFDALATAFRAGSEQPAFTDRDLRPYATAQVGYAVVSRGVVVLMFGALFLALGAGAFAFGRKGWLEHLGWLGPALALGTAGAVILLGERTRSTVPPTVAAVQVATAAGDEVDVHGLAALYRPSAGSSPVGTEGGGQLEVDTGGLEGRVCRRVQTDLDRWHWENLEMPAGVRTASFQYTASTQEPVVASARFGPDGIAGRLAAGPFRNPGDCLLHTPTLRLLTVRLEADGSFRAGSADVLPPGQYLTDRLLNDRQRDRQLLYAKLLVEPQPRYLVGRPLLLAWADPVDLPFALVPHARQVGSALLAVPLQYVRTPAGTRVTIPGPFLECRRDNGVPVRDLKGSWYGMRARLRFQVPRPVLPLRVEQARLTMNLSAPSREVVIGAFAGDQLIEVRRFQNFSGLGRVDIDDARLLRLDEQGGLSLSLTVAGMPENSGPKGPSAAADWSVGSLNLELQGQVLDVALSGGR
jgi:hypothetical protein